MFFFFFCENFCSNKLETATSECVIKRPLRKKINRQDKKYLTNEKYKIKFKQKKT